MKHVTLIFLMFFVLLNCSEQSKENYDLIIKNGNVIDIVSGEINQQDIYILNGRIKKIIEHSLQNVNAKEILDATGKYILPGFWDNHVHFRGGDSLIPANKEFLKLFVKNGITTVRDAGGDLTASVLEWKEQISKEELMGPTIYTSGPKIDGPNARWAGSLPVGNDDDVMIALDSLQQIGTDFVKLYDSTISGELYLETIQEAERKDMITSGHMPFTVELHEAVDAGLDAIEHLYYVLKGCSSEETEITQAIFRKELSFWKSMERLINTYDDSMAESTFNKLKYNDVYVVPTLHIGNVLSYLDEEDHQNDAYLKLMDDGIIKTYEERIRGVLNASDKSKKDRKELNTLFKKLTKSLSDADVKLLAGSDCGAYNSYTYPGISLHNELEAMVFVGMSPLKALQTSAYNGSHFLKKNDDSGTLEEGKVSGIVILNSNPLEKIKNTRDIYRVIIKNSIIDPSSF